jgi:sugar phosphate isomerase/epimerase
MQRRTFVKTMAASLVLPVIGCASSPSVVTASSPSVVSGRRLKRVGVQLYSLRDAAKVDLERTLADIAAIGYRDVELLGSMNNFGIPPERLRAVLDRLGLRAPSTHVGTDMLDDIDRQIDVAKTLGHEYLIVAGFPESRRKTLDDYRQWADRFNTAGAVARARGVWIAFHNHGPDVTPIDGQVPYDLFVDRTELTVVRQQLDTGNMAMGGRDPISYLERYGSRYWSFHIKDVPRMGATEDAELGKGIIDFRRLLARIDRIDEKLLYVEQETYPTTPLESVRRDYAYISALEF